VTPAEKPKTPRHWRWREGPVTGRAVVFDIDGVLSDASGRQSFLEGPKRDWEGFFDACGDDPLLEDVAPLLQLLDRDLMIVLLTGRPLRVQDLTVEWLDCHQLRWDLLVMRPWGDYSAALAFKEEALGELRSAGLEPLLGFEDDARNAEMFRRCGLPCVYIHSGYYG
jgi:hypothetical protein